MITRSALQAYTEKTTEGMTMTTATTQQEVAREIAVLLGHGSSVQAIIDELKKAKNISLSLPELRAYASAYDQVIAMIEQ